MLRFTKIISFCSSLEKVHLYFPWSSIVMLISRREQLLLFSSRKIFVLFLYLSLNWGTLSEELCLKTHVLFSICHLNSLSEFLLGQEHGRRTLSSKTPLIGMSSLPRNSNKDQSSFQIAQVKTFEYAHSAHSLDNDPPTHRHRERVRGRERETTVSFIFCFTSLPLTQ